MATIFCFTSTGNSLYAANRIAEKIGGKVVPMNVASSKCEDEVIGFVFPVYFWALPRMVERFVAEIQISNKNAYVFAVTTSGGSVFGVLGWLKKILKGKGIKLQYGRNLCSVSNYIPEYEAKDSEAIRQKVDEKIARIIGEIMNREVKRILPITIMNRIAYRLFPDERSDRFFDISSSCTGCRTCQKVCPANNITMETGNPDFRHKCEHCLACLHNCPVQAIDWKNKTQGKARYRNSGVTLNDLIAFNSDARGAKESMVGQADEGDSSCIK